MDSFPDERKKSNVERRFTMTHKKHKETFPLSKYFELITCIHMFSVNSNQYTKM